MYVCLCVCLSLSLLFVSLCLFFWVVFLPLVLPHRTLSPQYSHDSDPPLDDSAFVVRVCVCVSLSLSPLCLSLSVLLSCVSASCSTPSNTESTVLTRL